jgi:hypothetical protein
MILARISKAVREQKWFAVTLEFVIVVAGVLLAFQISQYAERRNMQSEARVSLEMLHASMEVNLARIESYRYHLAVNRDGIQALRQTLANLPETPDEETLNRQVTLAFNAPVLGLDLRAADQFESIPGRPLLERPDVETALHRWRRVHAELLGSEAHLDRFITALAEPGRYDGLSHESMTSVFSSQLAVEWASPRFPTDWARLVQDEDFAGHLAYVELMLEYLLVISQQLEGATRDMIELAEAAE